MNISNYYSAGMVFQHDQNNPVTGTGTDGKEVTVRLFRDGELIEQEKAVVNNGTWKVRLNRQKPGFDYRLVISDGTEEIVLDPIHFGDVYLLGGQSNIEYPLKDEKYFKDAGSLKNVSIFSVPRVEYFEDGKPFPDHEQAGWKKGSLDNLSDFSAIGYYIGKELDDLGIPVGLVSCNKGGTSASCWVDECSLKTDPDLYAHFWTEYWKDIQNQSSREEDTKRLRYQQILQDYQNRCVQFMIDHPESSRKEMKSILGHTPWPGPKGKKDAGRPCGLYQTMSASIEGIPFRSVVWYQGEEDTKDGEWYRRLLNTLVDCWQIKIPGKPDFYIVQLPGYEDEPDKKWPLVREAQRQICENREDCHLITSIDLGQSDNIHPVEKSRLGRRIAKAILDHEYGGKNLSQPEIIHVERTPEKTLVLFNQKLSQRSPKSKLSLKDDFTVVLPSDSAGYSLENNPEPVFYKLDETPLSPFYLDDPELI